MALPPTKPHTPDPAAPATANPASSSSPKQRHRRGGRRGGGPTKAMRGAEPQAAFAARASSAARTPS